MLQAMNMRGASLDIFLLPHADIKKLKARFIKKMTEPNVLSFPEPIGFPHPEKKDKTGGKRRKSSRYLGEIYLNQDILKRSPERALPLLAHGMLHLLGHDHKKKEEAKIMENREKAILEKYKLTY